MTINGTIDGREFRLKFKGVNGGGKPVFGRGLLTYQGPIEPLPRLGPGSTAR